MYSALDFLLTSVSHRGQYFFLLCIGYLIKNGLLVTADCVESEQHSACQYASSKLMAQRLMDTLPFENATVNNRAALAHGRASAACLPGRYEL